MSYLVSGNNPAAIKTAERNIFTATAGQTTFTITQGYQPGDLDVFLNGVRLVDGDDFNALNGSTVVLTSGAIAGDSLVVVCYRPYQVTDFYTKSEQDTRYVNATGDTMTGALTLTNSPIYSTASYSNNVGISFLASGTNTGWFKIAKTPIAIGSNGSRGSVRIIVNTTGGYYTPTCDVIELFKDWISSGGLTVKQLSAGSYFSNYRLTGDGDYTYLEGYLSGVTGYGNASGYDFTKTVIESLGADWSSGNYWTAISGTLQTGVATPTFTITPKQTIYANGLIVSPSQPFISGYPGGIQSTSATIIPLVTSETQNTTISSNRFTCPIAGLYECVYNCSVNNYSSTENDVWLYKNGTTLTHARGAWTQADTVWRLLHGQWVIKCNAGDYLEFFGRGYHYTSSGWGYWHFRLIG